MSKPLISIAIPTYEMHNKGGEYLNFALNGIFHQTYKDIEVVVSDHSINDDIKNVCIVWSKEGLNIRYIRNENDRGSSSANINNAISHSTGKYIKILFQDDFLYCADAIENTINALEKEPDKKWLISACEHSSDGIHTYRPFYPKYHNDIHLGINTISSPSVLTIRNENVVHFDNKLIWLMDVEYYKRLYIASGEPIILNNITVVNRTWENQLSSNITEELKNEEMKYVKNIYEINK
jgi:glycosyltransferase involved in cell wall biosynthesis